MGCELPEMKSTAALAGSGALKLCSVASAFRLQVPSPGREGDRQTRINRMQNPDTPIRRCVQGPATTEVGHAGTRAEHN